MTNPVVRVKAPTLRYVTLAQFSRAFQDFCARLAAGEPAAVAACERLLGRRRSVALGALDLDPGIAGGAADALRAREAAFND